MVRRRHSLICDDLKYANLEKRGLSLNKIKTHVMDDYPDLKDVNNLRRESSTQNQIPLDKLFSDRLQLIKLAKKK